MRALITAVVLVPLAACASPSAFDRGLADLRAGRYAEAKTAFDAALHASAAALVNRGVARARLGDLDGAIEDYTRALELVPGDADILFDRGQAWAAKGEYPRAVADFTRAAETDPRRAEALFRNAAVELSREPNAIAGRTTAAPPAAPAPPPAA
ncbi:MAG TPA: tetratricopeptide repeat protein, partial [Candidatus Limnocylindria bacterium]|nr:tetratricopeptide repeat protein [Candidatus Limnocylindria bacterium]